MDSANQFLDLYTPLVRHEDPFTLPILRNILRYAPTAEGRRNICDDITSCTLDIDNRSVDSDKLRQLAVRYKSGILLPMRFGAGKTPAGSSCPSRPSVESHGQPDEGLISKSTHHLSTLKSLALRRDRHRCVISGDIDYDSFGDDTLEFDRSVGKVTDTEVAHILPFSLWLGGESSTDVTKRSRVWENLQRFEGGNITELNGQKNNWLDNVMTLTLSMRRRFGALDCWLTGIEGQPNCYRLCKADQVPDQYMLAGRVIRFDTSDDQLLVPNPHYLALHAACAQVIHACGMSKYMDQFVRDMEGLRVLPEDGSSDALVVALQCVSGS